MNNTHNKKDVLLPDWSLRGISVTKWDRVHYEVKSEIQKFKLHTIIHLDFIKWKRNIFWIWRTFFNLYVAGFIAVYIKESLLAQGEFIKKSYVKTVLESRYTVCKYWTTFMVSKQVFKVMRKWSVLIIRASLDRVNMEYILAIEKTIAFWKMSLFTGFSWFVHLNLKIYENQNL